MGIFSLLFCRILKNYHLLTKSYIDIFFSGVYNLNRYNFYERR